MMNKQDAAGEKIQRLIKLEEMLKFQPQSIMGWATPKQRTCSWIYFILNLRNWEKTLNI